MGSCCGRVKTSISGLTLDSVLAYNTVKIVQINDKRLGILHYGMMFIIICYILGFSIFWQQRYLLLETPVGSVRTTLQSPQTKGILPPTPESLNYCQLPNHMQYGNFTIYPCLYWDEDLTVYPAIEQSAMFITTRLSVSNRSLFPPNCSLTSPNCHYKQVGNTSDYFIADIENFTLLIDHAMFTQMGIQANSLHLPGALVDSHGTVVRNLPINNTVGVEGQPDIMNVDVLYQAAGVQDLNQQSTSNGNRSIRDDGLVLLVFIKYSNTFSWNWNALRYRYHVTWVQGTKFKVTQPIYTKDDANIRVWDRHGIRLIFLQVGELGKFDFQTLLLTFVAGLGLLTVSTFLVDYVGLRVMPSTGSLYKKYKYLDTPAYSKINAGEYTVECSDGESRYLKERPVN